MSGKTLKNKVKEEDSEDEDLIKYQESTVPAKLSQKILATAKKQQDELDEDERIDSRNIETESFGLIGADADADEFTESQDDIKNLEANFVHDFQIDESDNATLNQFFSTKPSVRRTLGDVIMNKIHAKEEEEEGEDNENNENNIENEEENEEKDGNNNKTKINPKIIQVYTTVGSLMSRYRSGKLPKPFKIIPSLLNWEQILALTKPEKYTPQAMYQATKLFTSSLNNKLCQRFLNLILLPAVLEDIDNHKCLNYHYYQALKKSLYKPSAFMKGILLPLCENESCTLKEAIIIGSVMSKMSIPVTHSAAALLRIAEMPYSGSTSIFFRVLLDKKYSLPYKVIDAVVDHFLRFVDDDRLLPVLWHQVYIYISFIF